MATTVQELINYLSEIEDKEQPVFYQYLLAEHTSYSQEDFDKLVEEVEDSAADNLTNYMLDELREAESSVLESEPEEEEED
jgi:hypothetical protein